MNKYLKFGLIFIVAAVIIGGALFFLSGSDDTDDQNNTSSENTSENQTPISEADFVQQYSGPYTVTMNAQDNDGETITGTMKIESEERSHMNFTSQGEKAEFITYDGTYYIRTGDSGWIKYSDQNTQGNEAYVDSATIDEGTIEDLRGATKLSEEACGDETCSVYEVNQDGATSKLYVGNSSKYVQKVTGSSPDIGSYEFTYDYDTSFSIDVPQNAQELNIPQVPGVQ